MTHLRLLDPGYFRPKIYYYLDPDTGHRINGLSLDTIRAAGRLHRTSNGLPVADDFDLLVETQICERLPDSECTAVSGVRDTSCIHRGPEVRREVCVSCGGNIKAIVLACAVHGECTEFRHDVGVRQCWNLCPQRTPLTAPRK